MNRSTFTLAATLTLMAGALQGCERQPLAGPPTVRLGRDECAECGMLIGEDRSSCGLLVDDVGRRSYLLFDDIGCMLDLERRSLGERTVIERYVRDWDTREWVPAQRAHFLLADPQRLRTPMGSGIGSFATPEPLARNAGLAGRTFDYAGLAQARAEWMRERYGDQPASPTPPSPPPPK